MTFENLTICEFNKTAGKSRRSLRQEDEQERFFFIDYCMEEEEKGLNNTILANLRNLVRSHQKFSSIVAASLLVVTIGVIDALTSPELALSALYLIPIFLGTYYAGFVGGIYMSVASILVYLLADIFLSIRYSSWTIPYWNAGVRLVLFTSIAYAVAKRKLAEEKLSQSEERFRLLVEGAKEFAILMLDASGNIVSWNDGAERIYGYKTHEIIGKHFASFYLLEERELKRPEEHLQQARERGAISLEDWRVKENGKKFWAESIITPVETNSQTLRGFALLTRDITERKNAEKIIQVFAQLHEVDRAILAANSSAAIASEALRRLHQMVPYSFATVTRLDMELGQTFFLAARTATNETPEQAPSLLDNADYEDLEVLKQGTVLIVEDVAEMPRHPLDIMLPFNQIRSYMIVPLLSQGSLIGSVNIAFEQPHRLDSDHLNVTREVANQMAMALRNSDLFQDLRTAHQRLQLLNHKLLQAQETEKHHLARELHDEIGQALTALRIHLEEMDALTSDPALSQRLSESSLILERLLNQVRNLSLDLRPMVLDDLGLVAALRWYASSRSQLGGFAVHYEPDPHITSLPSEIETVCFRVAQEALTNVVRHAGANHVRVKLTLDGDSIVLSIKDDGRGFDLQEVQQRTMKGESFGLLGMKERALLVGGDLEIESVPSCGTQIRATLPLLLHSQVRK